VPDGARHTQQARWNEPLIFERGAPGQRGLLVTTTEPAIADASSDPVSALPAALRRRCAPALPEVGQPEVLRHYLRLSQQTTGADLTIDLGGTCTMKPVPRVHERVIRDHRIADLHPEQDPETVQGILEILHRTEQMLCSVSGLARFSFQPGGGAQGIYTNARIIRAFHAMRGEESQRTEIITTVYSHPSAGACAAAAGFDVTTLYPGPRGYPGLDALKAVVSERTAGLIVSNPEDTGIFNPEIDAFTALVHEAGGLCAYDQANANGTVGVARASDAGFDLCQFNLHKTFAAAHAATGMACGAVGASAELAPLLPVPTVEHADGRFWLETERATSIGQVRAFYGVVPTVVRAFAWLTSLGARGLRDVAQTAVLNNNYLAAKLSAVPGLDISYWPENELPRLEQIRYSWARLAEATGVTTDDLARRITDYGVKSFFTSHDPRLIAEPMTVEPTEAFSKADLDEFADIVGRLADDAYADPASCIAAPYHSAVHRINPAQLDDPDRWAVTWRAYQRKASAASVQADVAAVADEA
jgi:glycine dehydrogenase subunit 2